MANADELIREAQFAFRNISYGSTDESKYRSRAKKYAKRVIRKYPASVEASQARQILDGLNVKYDLPPPDAGAGLVKETIAFLKNHSVSTGHRASGAKTPQPVALENNEWKSILQRFLNLPLNRKRQLAIGLFFIFVFPFGFFALAGLAIFYGLNTKLLKEHLDRLLTTMGSP